MKKSLVLLLPLFFLWGITLSWGQKVVPSVGVKGQTENQPPSFAHLTSHFHKYVDDGVLAGTVMLLGQGDLIYMDRYGMQNIEKSRPMEYNTIFRLASMTKPITSVAVMMLVEEGKLRLDDPVEKFIPAFKKLQVFKAENETVKPNRPVTVRHLLSHTGGITSGFDPSPAGQFCAKKMKEADPESLEELVSTLAETPLAFHPGEGWAYSYSTDILAYIVEQVSGVPIDQFFQKKIFNPLGMNDTGFQVPDEKLDRFASLYATGNDGQLVLADAPKGSPYTDGTYFPRGNGGLTSTPLDYFRFAKMLQNGGEYKGGRLLKKETVEMMTHNILPSEQLPIGVGGKKFPGQGFGLGFGVLVGEPPFGSEGDFYWPGAAFTYFFVNPNTGTIAVFMTQLSDMSKMNIIWEFHDLASKVFDHDSVGGKQGMDR